MKKVLITGATGLIGSQLVKALHQDGIEVHYLTTRKSAIVDQGKLKGFYWNLSTQELDLQAFHGVDAIIHLAGASIAKRWTSKYKKEIITSRVESTQLLISKLAEIDHKVKRVISASGIGIYPSSRQKEYSEDDTMKSTSFLGKVVTEWEKSLHEFSTIDIPVTIMRTGVVFALEKSALQKIISPIERGYGAILGDGNQYISWIHIHDLIKAYQFVLTNKLSGVFNAVAPMPITNRDLTYAIAKIKNKKIFLPPVPVWALQLILGSMQNLLTESQYVKPCKLEDQGFEFSFNTPDKALENLL